MDSHLAALRVVEKRLGAAGQDDGVQGGGLTSSTAFAVAPPVAANACGDQRCEIKWMDGQTVGMLSLYCPEPQPHRERTAACFLRDVRDVHKRKVLCGLQSGGPRTPDGRKDTPSPESSGRSEAGGQASSLGPQPPQAHSAPRGYWGRSALQAVPGGLPGGVLAYASMVMSVPEGAARPASERSGAVLHHHFCLCARDGLPSATSRLTSRARKRSSCSCLLTAFLFSCLSNTLNPVAAGRGGRFGVRHRSHLRLWSTLTTQGPSRVQKWPGSV